MDGIPYPGDAFSSGRYLMRKLLTSLPFILLVAVIVGILVGLVANQPVMNVVVTIQYVLNQLIMFCVPLIIIGFIAPSITKLGSNVSRILSMGVLIAYLSSIGAAFFSTVAGYLIVPRLSIASSADDLRELPEVVFQLDIPQVMSVMSALVLAILVGLSAVWTKAKTVTRLLDEFQRMVLVIVTRIVIPILPVYIAATFCSLSYEGSITRQLPVFLIVVLIVIVGHYIWLALLYGIAGAYSGKNPLDVLRHWGPAYLTAIGTMSSSATLAVSLQCAQKAKPLRRDMASFGIPLFANIHLCGSVLTEVFFVMTISQMLYGTLPSVPTMILFCLLLGVFAVGAPGVPGGTVMASLGLITGIIGFGETGTSLILTIFALQDSFGTACNITGDGALTLFMTGYVERKKIPEMTESVDIFGD